MPIGSNETTVVTLSSQTTINQLHTVQTIGLCVGWYTDLILIRYKNTHNLNPLSITTTPQPTSSDNNNNNNNNNNNDNNDMVMIMMMRRTRTRR